MTYFFSYDYVFFVSIVVLTKKCGAHLGASPFGYGLDSSGARGGDMQHVG